MVNFRFHLISLVAVFLSLAIGISLGSGFVGEAITSNLREEIDSVRDQNGVVREENLELRDQLEDAETFAIGVRSWMIGGALQGDDVVFIRFDHTDTALSDAATSAVQDAGGTVAATLTVNDKLALADPEDADELAALVGETADEPVVIRSATARRLGVFMGQAAEQAPTTSEFGAGARVAEFTGSLEAAGYLSVEQGSTGTLIPSEAMFVILGGGSGRPGFNAWLFATTLTGGLLEQGSTVAIAERSASDWNLVRRVREDDAVSGSVVTVDHAESTTGQIALILALARAGQGVTGHYGSDEGASAPLPEASLD